MRTQQRIRLGSRRKKTSRRLDTPGGLYKKKKKITENKKIGHVTYSFRTDAECRLLIPAGETELHSVGNELEDHYRRAKHVHTSSMNSEIPKKKIRKKYLVFLRPWKYPYRTRMTVLVVFPSRKFTLGAKIIIAAAWTAFNGIFKKSDVVVMYSRIPFSCTDLNEVQRKRSRYVRRIDSYSSDVAKQWTGPSTSVDKIIRRE